MHCCVSMHGWLRQSAGIELPSLMGFRAGMQPGILLRVRAVGQSLDVYYLRCQCCCCCCHHVVIMLSRVVQACCRAVERVLCGSAESYKSNLVRSKLERAVAVSVKQCSLVSRGPGMCHWASYIGQLRVWLHQPRQGRVKMSGLAAGVVVLSILGRGGVNTHCGTDHGVS
jgi:hypothetical protein